MPNVLTFLMIKSPSKSPWPRAGFFCHDTESEPIRSSMGLREVHIYHLVHG